MPIHLYFGIMQFSVIIPVFNEEENISARVLFLRQYGGESIKEIIVVDGRSDDSTREVAEASGAVVFECPQRSRAAQMNLGAKHATGEILYFTHADVELLASFVNDIHSALNEGHDAGCYRYVFDSKKFMLRINAWFTRFDRLMCRGGDQTLFIKRDVFQELRGFDENYTIMEDYDLIIRLRKKYSFRIIQKDVTTSARKYDTNSWLRVQVSNLTVFIMFYLKVAPDTMKRAYARMLHYR